MEFYILIGSVKEGPFRLEDLPNKGITNETKVWSVGFTDWKMASEVPELEGVLLSIPPPIPNKPPMPKTWMVESILVTCCCCLPLGVVGIINSTKVESHYSQGDYKNAEHYSLQAKKWTLWGFFTTLAFSILYILVVGVIAITPFIFK